MSKPNFMILDEAFVNLDKNHLQNLENLFNYVKKKFDFIIIVSHIDILKDFMDNCIYLNKVNGVSKIVND
jgi:DNA repair exonuclease SbcCD ATPase subunit